MGLHLVEADSDFVGATLSPWFWLILGAVASVIVAKAWDKLSAPVRRGWASVTAYFAIVRGQSPAVSRLQRQPDSAFPDYFRQQDRGLDLAVYELSLRPGVPLMDLLYFEYLRTRLEDGSISQLLVIPWSGWRDDANSHGEDLIRQRVKAVFGRTSPRVTVVTAADLQANAETIFDNRFFERLGYLGDNEFLRNASIAMGYRFRSYDDINRSHPATHRARSIVEHTVRGWLIFKYIESSRLDQGQDTLRIGSLMWEQEITKLLMLGNLAEHEGVECTVMVGKTVSFGWRRKRAIPTFDNTTLEIFGDLGEISRVLSLKSKSELRQTHRVLRGILDSRPQLWAATPVEVALRGGEARAVMRELLRVRALYGIRDASAVV